MGSPFSFLHRLLRGHRQRIREIDPDEIFLDAHNLPQFNLHQFEGRIEKPISPVAFRLTGAAFVLSALIFAGQAWWLQVANGQSYAKRSENNRLDHTLIFAKRGVIYDRNGLELAWNIATETVEDYARRAYRETNGLTHVVGYVNHPRKDKSGRYYQETSIGKAGVEETYNDRVAGVNGLKIVETDALGNIQSEGGMVRPPEDGENLTLSIDARLNEQLYKQIQELSERAGFNSGAAVLLDVESGELVAAVSYPEYNQNVLSSGEDSAAINGYLSDKQQPFLNRISSGLFTPGSIMKLFVAFGALKEQTIDPGKEIFSAGKLELPNPYNPNNKSIFNDWKAHGWVDMRRALAVSSDVYFYVVGGGFQGQKGLGITNIEKYYRLFGYGAPTGIDLSGEKSGTIPNPTWKEANFDGDPWRVGDTYFTAIGQYGLQVTPIQAARSVAAIANGGMLPTPHLLKDDPSKGPMTFPKIEGLNLSQFAIVREGMRQAVTEGTAAGLNVDYVAIAAKTGTAEVGTTKARVNAWVVGYYPYEKPKYAFVVMMEQGPRANTVGGVYIMRQFLDWMYYNAPEYL